MQATPQTEAFYPGPTDVQSHVSILTLAFSHQIRPRQVDQWAAVTVKHGWRAHPYMRRDSTATRQFAPFISLSVPGHRALLGHDWSRDAATDERPDATIIKERLGKPDQRNLLLTLEGSAINRLGETLETWQARQDEPEFFRFMIEWADLWVFDDESGMLALSLRLGGSDNSPDRNEQIPMTRLARFHRHIRDWDDHGIRVRGTQDEGDGFRFWHDLVFESWLGLRPGQAGAGISLLGGCTTARPQDHMDGSGHYARLLTGVQLPEVADGAEGLAWDIPLTDVSAEFSYQIHLDALKSGTWHPSMQSYQAGVIAGYPTFRDLVLFELATVSDEGAAGGLNGERGWQYSLDYMRRMLDEQGIDVWEYWSGLALRDVCAFVSWSDSMPLIRRNQLEARYYPLFVYAYHLRFALDSMAEDSVDHDLVEIRNLRHQLRRFQQFRSRYWFKEVSIDFQGVEVFEKMKLGMNIDAVYTTVSDELNEVSGYLETVGTRGRQALVTLALAAAYPVYVWFTYAGEHVGLAYLAETYRHFNSNQPLLAGFSAIALTALSFTVLALAWTRFGPRLSRRLQRVYSWLAREIG